MAQLGTAVKSLEGQTGRIQAFRAVEADTRAAGQAWLAAQQRLRGLQAEIVATDAPTAKMRREISRAAEAADKARDAYVGKKSALASMRGELTAAGIAVANLGAEERRLGAALEQTRAKALALGSAMAQRDALKEQRSTQMGDALKSAVLPGAMIAGMKQAVSTAGDFEHGLMRFGNTAGMTGDAVSAVRSKLIALSGTTNQSATEMLGGLEVLVGRGLDPTRSLASMETIGRAATATGAAVEDMAKTAFALQDALAVKPEGLAKALDSLAQSGKSGGFELKDMAKHLPVLAAQAKGLKMEGADAVASLGAALQLAFKGTGNADAAATNLTNFMAKITAKDAVDNFKKMGVNLENELGAAMKSGSDPILFMIERINKLTGGDQFKLNELFGDQQVKQFILPMLQNMEEFKRIKKDALTAEGVLDKDFATAMGTFNERTKGFGIAIFQAGEALGKIFLPPLGAVIEVLTLGVRTVAGAVEAFPNFTMGVLGAALAITGFKTVSLGLAAVGTTMRLISVQGAIMSGTLSPAFSAVGARMMGLIPMIGAANAAMNAWIATQARAALAGVKGFPGQIKAMALALQANTLALWQGARAQALAAGSATMAILRNTMALMVNAWTVVTTAAGWRMMATAMGSGLVGTISAVTGGLKALTLALVSNPVGLLVAAIAASAALIYKYWAPISGFFSGVWSGIVEATEPVHPMFEGIGRVVGAILTPVTLLWDAISSLLEPVEDVDGAAQAMGKLVGATIGGVVNDIGGLFKGAAELANGFFAYAEKAANWVSGLFGRGGQQALPAPALGDAMPEPANDNRPALGDAMPKAANDNRPALGQALPPAANDNVEKIGAVVRTRSIGNLALAPSAPSVPALGAALAPDGMPSPPTRAMPLPAPPPAPGHAATASSGAMTVHATFNITAAPGMDEKAIAAQVRHALDDAMRKAEAERRAALHD